MPGPSWSSGVRRGDARRHKRFPIEGTLHVLCQDSSGRERLCNAKIMDVSVSGVRLRMDERVSERSFLTCNDRKLGISGRGVVRYCNFVKGKYEVGIEFTGGTGWGGTPAEAPAVRDPDGVKAG